VIISRTPFRVSLFGGGTDYPAWYLENGGAVIGTTINKYCYVSIRNLPPFFEHRHRIVYSRIELPNTIDEIEHPAVRAVLEQHPVRDGVEIQYNGDLPARSGVGSSSSFTVGLLNAVRAFQGRMSSMHWLATEAIRIEQEVIQEPVGSQDQVWAAYGGTNLITFQSDGSFNVSPVVMTRERREELQSHMLLFFTGFSRIAGNIAAQEIPNLRNRASQLEAMTEMVYQAAEILQNPARPIAELGSMLKDAWTIKKELADCRDSGGRARRKAARRGRRRVHPGDGGPGMPRSNSRCAEGIDRGFVLHRQSGKHHRCLRARWTRRTALHFRLSSWVTAARNRPETLRLCRVCSAYWLIQTTKLFSWAE
jgi:D-glycero-alpha-D-manno-heptose-7-phosphate kinase